MARFRRQTKGYPVVNWWSNGGNQIGFGRGRVGYVVINKESYELNARIQTALPEGSYCDLIHNDSNSGCTRVQVDASGYMQVKVPATDSVAFLVGF